MEIKIILDENELNRWYGDCNEPPVFSSEIAKIAHYMLNDIRDRFHNPNVRVVVESNKGVKLHSPEY